MRSLIVSTVIFFVVSHFAKRYVDDMGLPKGMTRGMLIFSVALLAAYVAAAALDKLAPG